MQTAEVKGKSFEEHDLRQAPNLRPPYPSLLFVSCSLVMNLSSQADSRLCHSYQARMPGACDSLYQKLWQSQERLILFSVQLGLKTWCFTSISINLQTTVMSISEAEAMVRLLNCGFDRIVDLSNIHSKCWLRMSAMSFGLVLVESELSDSPRITLEHCLLVVYVREQTFWVSLVFIPIDCSDALLFKLFFTSLYSPTSARIFHFVEAFLYQSLVLCLYSIRISEVINGA